MMKALVILYLLLNACLMNGGWLTPSILHLVLLQRQSNTTFWNNQEISLFDHIHFKDKNQGVLYKYLESDFHLSSVRYVHGQLSENRAAAYHFKIV